MKSSKLKKIIILTSLALLVTGCSSRPMPLTKMQTTAPKNYETLHSESVSATGFILLGIIPIRMSSRELRARNTILANSGGDDLINTSISSGYFWTPIGIFARVTIKGTPIKKGVAPIVLLNTVNE